MHGLTACSGRTTSSAPAIEAAARRLVLRRHDHVVRLERLDRDQRQDPDRAGADDVDRPARRILARNAADRARERLDQHRGLVPHPVGHRPEL